MGLEGERDLCHVPAKRGPAVQFKKIKDYENAKQVSSLFAGPGFIYYPEVRRLVHGRIALGLGLEKDIDYEELQETIIERQKAPIRAMEVDEGPCQEVVIEGQDIDLYKLPIPQLNGSDGGRYLTSQIVFPYDSEMKWTNMGIYRLILAGKNKLVHGGIPRRIEPTHIAKIVQKAAERNEPVPFAIAIAIGAPAPLYATATMNLPPQADEYSIAEGFGANPLALVKAKLSDILIPAEAEIIMEGYIYPGVTAEEGLFTSISYCLPKQQGFVYDVELITHREDPIVPFVRKTIFIDPDVRAQKLAIALTDRISKVNHETNVFVSRMSKPLGLIENHGFDGSSLSSTWTVDATWRFDRPEETKGRRGTFEAAIPKEVRDKVLTLWKKLGIKPEPFVMDL